MELNELLNEITRKLQGHVAVVQIFVDGEVHVRRVGAFMNSTLAEIEFPNVTNIQWNVFRGARLTEATLPATVTNIGEYSFYCTNMTKLTILATTPPAVTLPPSNATCLFYVPASSLEAYKSASGWSTMASRIYAIPD